MNASLSRLAEAISGLVEDHPHLSARNSDDLERARSLVEDVRRRLREAEEWLICLHDGDTPCASPHCPNRPASSAPASPSPPVPSAASEEAGLGHGDLDPAVLRDYSRFPGFDSLVTCSGCSNAFLLEEFTGSYIK
ncbi:hypothetical protein ACJ41O_003157 [Fusarium nematophilum]